MKGLCRGRKVLVSVITAVMCLNLCTGVTVHAQESEEEITEQAEIENSEVVEEIQENPDNSKEDEEKEVFSFLVRGETYAAGAQNGLVRIGGNYQYYKDGKPVKDQWKTINGCKYYFKSNGNAAVKAYKIDGTYYVFDGEGKLLKPKKDALVTVGDKKFYISSKGTPISGWRIIKNKLYYVRKNGCCATNETIDNITFTKKGYAKNNSASKLKMKTMQVVAKIIKPGMSKKQKLKACWYYINTFRFRARSYPDQTKKNWKYQCALDMLNQKRGNCYGIANAFAALAKEVGYEPYVIEIPKIHCWVRINGKYWDNMGNRMGVSKPQRKYRKSQITKF